jgi:hypothetical protein
MSAIVLRSPTKVGELHMTNRREDGVTEYLRNALKDVRRTPCAYQTDEEIEQYYRNSPIGSPAIIRHTQWRILKYEVSTIEGRRHGRVYVPSKLGGSSFYIRSKAGAGANTYEPKGQSSLVIPTDAVLAFANATPSGIDMAGMTTFA